MAGPIALSPIVPFAPGLPGAPDAPSAPSSLGGPGAPAASAAARPGKPSFADALVEALMDARKAENTADDLAERFAAGDPEVGIHETMIAAEKAQVTTRFAVTLKNRAIEAYRELMNTPV